MILQYRTKIKPEKVHFLHHEDFREPQIQDCLISWECRIPLKEDGITEMYIETKEVCISYRRWLGNPNENEEITLDKETTIETFRDCNVRVRFIDKNLRPSIKPVEIYIEYNDNTEENEATLIEFSK